MHLLLQGKMTVLATTVRILSVGLLELNFAQPALQPPDEHLVALVRRLNAAVGVPQQLDLAQLCFDNAVLFRQRILKNINLGCILHNLRFFLPQQLADLRVAFNTSGATPANTTR
jgi:hypothetical protein